MQPAVSRSAWMEENVSVPTPATVPPGGTARSVRFVSISAKKPQSPNTSPSLEKSSVFGSTPKGHIVVPFPSRLSSLWTKVSVWEPLHPAERLRLQKRVLGVPVLQEGNGGFTFFETCLRMLKKAAKTMRLQYNCCRDNLETWGVNENVETKNLMMRLDGFRQSVPNNYW